jgi:hypothetical protein
LKHYFISIRLYLPLLEEPYSLDAEYLQLFQDIYKIKNSYRVPLNNTDLEMNDYLRDENYYLDKALKGLDKFSYEDSEKVNWEIDHLRGQLAAVNKLNVDQVANVLEKIVDNSNELSTDLLMSTSQYSKKIRLEYHQSAERLSVERNFLRNIIYQLEHRQISDSIKYISEINSGSAGNGGRFYEVWFDDSVSKGSVY